MKSSEPLSLFLQEQLQQGVSLGEATFTLDRTSALQKLARHALQGEGAWLLKAVQLAVASGCREGISITSSRNRTRLVFDTKKTWSNGQLMEIFWSAEPCRDEESEHFKLALWGAGLAAGHPFVLRLPGQTEELVWSCDETLQERAFEGSHQMVELAVSHQRIGETSQPFWSTFRQTARINAEILHVLLERAYTCPVPLTFDGRRLDSFLAPSRGTLGQVVEMALLDATGCPSFGFPKASLIPTPLVKGRIAGALERLGAEAVKRVEMRDSVGLCCLYLAHLGEGRDNKNSYLRSGLEKSTLRWVKDGVVISSESFPIEPTSLSVDCYASASGLPTDLSTLALVSSRAKAERTALLLHAVAKNLLMAREFAFQDLLEVGKRQDRGDALVIGLAGLLLLPIFPLSLAMFSMSYKSAKNPGATMSAILDVVQKGYLRLQQGWIEAYPETDPAWGGQP